MQRVDALGARWRERAAERAAHAAKGAQLEAEMRQLRARFGQLVSVAGPALDGGKVLLAGFDQPEVHRRTSGPGHLPRLRS